MNTDERRFNAPAYIALIGSIFYLRRRARGDGGEEGIEGQVLPPVNELMLVLYAVAPVVPSWNPAHYRGSCRKPCAPADFRGFERDFINVK